MKIESYFSVNKTNNHNKNYQNIIKSNKENLKPFQYIFLIFLISEN